MRDVRENPAPNPNGDPKGKVTPRSTQKAGNGSLTGASFAAQVSSPRALPPPVHLAAATQHPTCHSAGFLLAPATARQCVPAVIKCPLLMPAGFVRFRRPQVEAQLAMHQVENVSSQGFYFPALDIRVLGMRSIFQAHLEDR